MIAVIVPAYCEQNHIGQVVGTIPPEVDLIVVVDDASTDGTAAIVRAIDDPRLEFVGLETNVGHGGAVKIGFGIALAAGAEICVTMDGDGQMDPNRLPDLIEPLLAGSADYAKGNRFHSRNSYRGMPPVRVLGNLTLTWMMQWATGLRHIRDPLNGYTAITADTLRRIDLGATGDRATFLLDLLGQLRSAGATVVDVSIPARYGEETSHLRLSAVAVDLLTTPLAIASGRPRRRARNSRPLSLVGKSPAAGSARSRRGRSIRDRPRRP